MITTTLVLKANQGARQAKFPKNRIAFNKSEASAKDDRIAFARYYRNEITLSMLCEIVARNNFLDDHWDDHKVPEKMMLNELKELGWIR